MILILLCNMDWKILRLFGWVLLTPWHKAKDTDCSGNCKIFKNFHYLSIYLFRCTSYFKKKFPLSIYLSIYLSSCTLYFISIFPSQYFLLFSKMNLLRWAIFTSVLDMSLKPSVHCSLHQAYLTKAHILQCNWPPPLVTNLLRIVAILTPTPQLMLKKIN